MELHKKGVHKEESGENKTHDIARRLIRKMANSANNLGAEFAVLLIRIDNCANDRILGQYLQEEKIDCITLSNGIEDPSELKTQKLRFKFDAHWNNLGHNYAAKAIYNYIIQ